MRGVRRRLPQSEAAAVGRRGIEANRYVRSLSSSSAATADGSGSGNGNGVCPTVLIRRQFLLQVHPDFFARAQYAKVRA
jgi:hypothetical protein